MEREERSAEQRKREKGEVVRHHIQPNKAVPRASSPPQPDDPSLQFQRLFVPHRRRPDLEEAILHHRRLHLHLLVTEGELESQ